MADIVQAIAAAPGATLVAAGDSALAAILALAGTPVERAILDVDQFDTASDAAFVARLYIPGLRRAGDLQTALSMTTANLVIHNAGDRFAVTGPRIEPRKLTPAEIVALLKTRQK